MPVACVAGLLRVTVSVFSQARNNSDKAPLALWLTGGPGCSSELAVFVENGPYQLNDKGEVEEREFAWDVEVSQGRCSSATRHI